MNYCVKLFREKLADYKITQKELAEASNRSTSNISEIFSGKVSPSLDSFTLLLDTCDRLQPGFKQEYFRALQGDKIDLDNFVSSLSSNELAILMMSVGQRIRKLGSRETAIAA